MSVSLARDSSPAQGGVWGSGTALRDGELVGAGGLPCRAEDEVKTQRETESLVMPFKQVG